MQHVFFNFQGSAVFGVLAFLGTVLALLLLAALFVLLIGTGRRRPARWAALAAGGLVGAYAAVLLAQSALSRPQAAEIGEEKYFCEVDCHLAYSVTGVRREKRLGTAGKEAAARGVFTIVTVKTRFDEKTISPGRGQEPLTPNGRKIAVMDAHGSVLGASPEGTAALRSAGGGSTPLTTPLRPSESYTTTLVFDLPTGVPEPRLFLTESAWVTRFLIGHENSFGHAKTVFLLEEGTRRAAPHSTRTSAFPVPIFPVALSRTLTTTR